MSRTEELHKIFEGVDEGKRAIVNNLIDEAVYLETQLTELKKYPFIKLNRLVNQIASFCRPIRISLINFAASMRTRKRKKQARCVRSWKR